MIGLEKNALFKVCSLQHSRPVRLFVYVVHMTEVLNNYTVWEPPSLRPIHHLHKTDPSNEAKALYATESKKRTLCPPAGLSSWALCRTPSASLQPGHDPPGRVVMGHQGPKDIKRPNETIGLKTPRAITYSTSLCSTKVIHKAATVRYLEGMALVQSCP